MLIFALLFCAFLFAPINLKSTSAASPSTKFSDCGFRHRLLRRYRGTGRSDDLGFKVNPQSRANTARNEISAEAAVYIEAAVVNSTIFEYAGSVFLNAAR